MTGSSWLVLTQGKILKSDGNEIIALSDSYTNVNLDNVLNDDSFVLSENDLRIVVTLKN